MADKQNKAAKTPQRTEIKELGRIAALDKLFEKTTYNELPFKFEAGTPDYIGSTALAEALKYVENIGIDNIAAYETELTRYATAELMKIEGMRIFGTSEHKSAVISFLVGDIHPYDIGMLLDKLGIAVRTGHHCAQPLIDQLGIRTAGSGYFLWGCGDVVCIFYRKVWSGRGGECAAWKKKPDFIFYGVYSKD
jgi:hypothetical protein